MRRIFLFLLLPGIAILCQRCDDESEPCEGYRIISQTNIADGKEVMFNYNTDGSLQSVSGPYPAETNFFYTGDGQLARVHKTRSDNSRTVWFFDFDAKGRVISKYVKSTDFGDSTVFEYDDNDRMIKVSHYWRKAELVFYIDLEYPDASTVKNTTYLRGQYTPELNLAFFEIYTIDNHPRPHPYEYYLSQDLLDDTFLLHNVLSERLIAEDGTTVASEITHTYSYNGRGYPSSQDVVLKFVYGCE
ncbi:hypothetical protein WBG78_30580 [Chryseolinea sp. T2]|uniref:hypothetical protein n=1 Tax=Chryseolinea sp. T2 TaxID=3129255 RepID=UPI0030786CAA